MKPSLEESTASHLLVETSDRIARVTLNRPERRNALSLDLMRELIDCFKTIGASAESGSGGAVSVSLYSQLQEMFFVPGTTSTSYSRDPKVNIARSLTRVSN